MKAHKIKDGIYWVGAVDWDQRLFDSLILLPYSTSYNGARASCHHAADSMCAAIPRYRDGMAAASVEVKALSPAIWFSRCPSN